MKLYIKHMVCQRCRMAVKEALSNPGLHDIIIDLGVVEIEESITPQRHEQLKVNLSRSGLELMDDKTSILIDRIKTVIIEMIHDHDELSNINYSDYISEKLSYDYTYLSNIFCRVKGITIQHFIIVHKIEKVKELLSYGRLNLAEISYKLHYSSVSHLSNQFKKITGLSPSFYKTMGQKMDR